MKRIIATLFALTLTAPHLLAQAAQDITNTPQEPQQPTEQAQQDAAVNEVRIVRLSQVRGGAQMDRNAGAGFETAFPNLPITRNIKLKTTDGTAEVEFEDNSTLRLAPDTEVAFPVLSRNAVGATASTVKLVHGMIYVTVAKSKLNSFTVRTDRGNFELPPNSHIRLIVYGTETNLAVFKGNIKFDDGVGIATIGQSTGLLLDTTHPGPPTLLSEIDENPFDAWDKSESDYYKRNHNASAFAGSSALYGAADLNYYGSFTNIAGCGNVWRPYFASAAWDPYANGIWAWYPGAGYSWVSAYPWGWAPFHYGNWMQCAGGWGWQPGGSWYGLRNTVVRLPFNPPHGGPNRPLPPIHPPIHPPVGPGKGTIPRPIAINKTPLTVNSFSATTNSFLFRKDSAGLGIPRDAFRHLDKTSANVASTGVVSVPVHPIYRDSGGNPNHPLGFDHTGANGTGGDRSANAGNASTPNQPRQPYNPLSGPANRNAGSANVPPPHGGYGPPPGGSRNDGGGNRGSYTPPPGGGNNGGGNRGSYSPPPSAPAPSAPAPSAPAPSMPSPRR